MCVRVCVCVCVMDQRSEPAALNRRGCGASADEHMAAVTASQLRVQSRYTD